MSLRAILTELERESDESVERDILESTDESGGGRKRGKKGRRSSSSSSSSSSGSSGRRKKYTKKSSTKKQNGIGPSPFALPPHQDEAGLIDLEDYGNGKKSVFLRVWIFTFR